MKANNTYKLRVITFIIAATISLLVLSLHLFSHKKTQKIYLEQTEKVIINMKKDFIKDIVNNVVIEIDKSKKAKYSSYKKNTEYRLSRLEEELELSDKEFISFFIDKFESDQNSKMWTALLWNNKTGEILYDSSKLNMKTIDDTKKNLKSLLSSYSVIEKGNIEGIFGVEKAYIDEIVKTDMADILRNREFSNGSYIWVNEVLNYEGGENYAIRRVHPNISQKEGEYLSTDMKDVKGNYPYLEELEGINKNGELFFSYYFEELNSLEISEKITYAKLYKDFNWIIAMGVQLDEIDIYAQEINKEISYLSGEYIMRLLLYIFIVLLIGFILIYLIENKSTKSLKEEIDVDVLTKAISRRCGEKNLNMFLNRYKSTGKNAAVMMFDIDDFKQINDKYGHEYGDLALVEVVNMINSTIRNSDQLIRWGGDEFIGIFPGLREENLIEFGQKILDEISSLEISVGNKVINVSISIGFSYFEDDDKDYNDVLKRADEAMYKSKQDGTNKVSLK